jgi:hypothetical protein
MMPISTLWRGMASTGPFQNSTNISHIFHMRLIIHMHKLPSRRILLDGNFAVLGRYWLDRNHSHIPFHPTSKFFNPDVWASCFSYHQTSTSSRPTP